MKNFRALLFICISAALFSCTSNTKEQEKSSSSTVDSSISVIYHKTYGLTEMYLCFAKDTDWSKIERESSELVKNAQLGFVYCYDDRNKIKNLTDLPEDKVDYFCELIKRPGDPIEFNKVIGNYKKVEEQGDISKIKFVLIDKKERNCFGQKKSICRWYVFYIENYFDSNELIEKMKNEATKLPVDNPNDKTSNNKKLGFTEVYFFKEKINAPKLDKDGGWGPKESSNSMDKKYGKFLVGHISLGAGEDLYFSKGF